MSGIELKDDGKSINWKGIALGCAEAATQALLLSNNGFANAISALFRVGEDYRDSDNLHVRAMKLSSISLMYAVSAFFAEQQFGRTPTEAQRRDAIVQLGQFVESCLNRPGVCLPFDILVESIQCSGESIVITVVRKLFELCAAFEPMQNEQQIQRRFAKLTAAGQRRTYMRRLDYYLQLEEFKASEIGASERLEELWLSYNARLVERYEKEVLFADEDGTTLSQVYQPLRVSWDDGPGYIDDPDEKEQKKHQTTTYVRMFDDAIDKWLSSTSAAVDPIRLISGGPGSEPIRERVEWPGPS